jgi:chromosomal replication initiator protein
MLRVTRQNYDTWLRSTLGCHYDGSTLVVKTNSDLTCDWLSTRMSNVIAQSLSAVAGRGIPVRFEPHTAPLETGDEPRQPPLLPRPDAPLNPRFTFATFLEGAFNQLALRSARLLLDGEGAYSPLYVTGGPGSGKTHLLHAIAHEAAKVRRPFILAGAERFMNEYSTAVQKKDVPAFRSRYRDAEMLLIDDIHLLLGRKATLNELIKTIRSLADRGHVVVVTGDPSRAATSDSERFQGEAFWKLAARIDDPETADRARFVEAKLEQQGVTVPDDVKQYLALRVRTSVRDLEIAVNRLAALAKISRTELSIDFAARAMEPLSAPTKDNVVPAPQRILDAVCEHLGFNVAQLRSPGRARELTYARHLAMYLLRGESGLTYAAIAQCLDKKDHSTVVHACNQISNDLGNSPNVRADIDAVKALVHRQTTAA